MGSGLDIESEAEEEYIKSSTTDEDQLEQSVFGTVPIQKQRRGCQRRGGIRGGINVPGERRELNHHKMNDLELNHHKMRDQLLHELLQKEKSVQIEMMILVVMKKIIIDGLEKSRHLPFIPFKQILEFLLKCQKICNLFFSLKFFSTIR